MLLFSKEHVAVILLSLLAIVNQTVGRSIEDESAYSSSLQHQKVRFQYHLPFKFQCK